MSTRDIAKFIISNLNEEVDAENLASFLGLTSSYQELGPCTVRVQEHPATGLCLGCGIVYVPESRAKRLLAHNGRKFFGGQPIVIHPAVDDGSTSSLKMDSSTKNTTNQTPTKTDLSSELVTTIGSLRMDSTPRSTIPEPSAQSSPHKTEAGSASVKSEHAGDMNRLKNSTPRKFQGKPSPHKTDAGSLYALPSNASQPKPRSSRQDRGEPAESQTRFFRRETKGAYEHSHNKYSAVASTGTMTSVSALGDGREFSTWVDDGAAGPQIKRRPYRLIDIGANLTHRKYAADLPQVIQRSKAAGVQKVIVTGLNVRGSQEALQMCQEYPGYLYCTVGVHPHDAKSWRSHTLDRLEYLARQPGCVAIGECGLDFNRNYSPRDTQLDVFEKQVQLACKVGKPLLLHDRESHESFLKILSKYQTELPSVVCHCFTGRRTEALKYISMGFYIGITGYLWKDNSTDGLRSLLYDDEIPLDKILLETDAPFMYPFIGRGRFPQSALDCVSPGSRQLLDCCSYQRNEPCAMPIIVELVAGCMKRSPAELADITTENALTFFGLRT